MAGEYLARRWIVKKEKGVYFGVYIYRGPGHEMNTDLVADNTLYQADWYGTERPGISAVVHVITHDIDHPFRYVVKESGIR